MRIFVSSMVDLEVQNAERTHLQEKWKNMAALGHDVHLWALRAPRDLEGWENVRIHIPWYLPIRGLAEASYQFFAFLHLLGQSLRRTPHLIYIRNASLDVAPMMISSIFRIPLVLEVPSLPHEDSPYFSIPRLKLRIRAHLFRAKLRRAGAIVTVTEGIRSKLVEMYKGRLGTIHVIRNAANTSLFRPMDRVLARQTVNLPPGVPIIGFVGSMFHWHGLHVLVAASPTILKTLPDVLFVLVGEGSQTEALKIQAAKLGVMKNFVFFGAIPYADVPFYVASCDLMASLILQRDTEETGYSPLKLYEYMAAGRPTIASRLVGFEILEKVDAGVLVEPGSPEAFAEAAILLLKDRERLRRMGKNARKVAVKECDWRMAAEQTERILQQAS